MPRQLDNTATWPFGAEPTEVVDPDPFTIALGLFAAAVGGGAFLEARRQRQDGEAHRRGEFRSTWYQARRTLIHFKRNTDEFDLSNHLGPDDRAHVERIHETLTEVGIPESYADVIKTARTAASLYAELLDNVDEREEFSPPSDER